MLSNNLIKSCVCKNTELFTTTILNHLRVVSCEQCGVIHQELKGWSDTDYFNFYNKDYHKHYQEKKGVITYANRYEHDRKISKLRLSEYALPTNSSILDVGSSNSAFVHECIEQGHRALGLEPGNEIGDSSVTIRGTLETIKFNQSFDVITMHDSIEHMIDVNFSLNQIYNILNKNGLLILDLPDYFIDAGKHHWKYIEHLWFFTQEQMTTILANHSFNLFQITKPIPGKLVFYSRKK